MTAAEDLARSAAEEWSRLVTAAVLGTDRRPLGRAEPGWESPVPSKDPAIELLGRAAALATARRAGRCPAPAVSVIAAAPADPRPPCPPAAADVLARLLAGHNDVLMPEWLALCHSAGFQLPATLLPALLLRGRRNPAFDAAVRACAGERATWLAEAMPELRIAPHAKPLPAGIEPLLPPARPPDSGAVAAAIVGTFHDHTATWAAAGQMRIAVASLDPTWLPPLIRDLNGAPFHAVTERTRVELLGVAQLRDEINRLLRTPGNPEHAAGEMA